MTVALDALLEEIPTEEMVRAAVSVERPGKTIGEVLRSELTAALSVLKETG